MAVAYIGVEIDSSVAKDCCYDAIVACPIKSIWPLSSPLGLRCTFLTRGFYSRTRTVLCLIEDFYVVLFDEVKINEIPSLGEILELTD
jgi:hypothetical protein